MKIIVIYNNWKTVRKNIKAAIITVTNIAMRNPIIGCLKLLAANIIAKILHAIATYSMLL